VNAYEIATDWGTNAGCGADVTDAQLDQFFASLRPNSLVRFWAFQGTMATNATTGQIDWGPLDRVFATAAAYGQRLVPVLTDQGGSCDGGHWQDPSWYNGGFEQVEDDPSPTTGVNQTPLSYWDYVQAIVNRYKDSPALGMWEPISEAEASTCPSQYEPSDCSGNQTCPDETVAAQALRYFFDAVGREIHTLDPEHLVESGLLGGGQCGTQGTDYQYVSASPGVDVLSYHDYYPANQPMGGDQWNGLAVRFSQAESLDKPIIGGEVGIIAGSGNGCLTDSGRVSDVQAKLQAQLSAGSSGLLLWNWVPGITQPCSYDIAPGDPVLSLLASVAL
jgi:mannan endo-1,4-beta-mannosidase